MLRATFYCLSAGVFLGLSVGCASKMYTQPLQPGESPARLHINMNKVSALDFKRLRVDVGNLQIGETKTVPSCSPFSRSQDMPGGAKIWIDGKRPTLNNYLKVNPGLHEIRVQAASFPIIRFDSKAISQERLREMFNSGPNEAVTIASDYIEVKPEYGIFFHIPPGAEPESFEKIFNFEAGSGERYALCVAWTVERDSEDLLDLSFDTWFVDPSGKRAGDESEM